MHDETALRHVAAVLIGLGTASAVPDKIESSIGTLNLDYGYPAADTVDKFYDNPDRSRALAKIPFRCVIPLDRKAIVGGSIMLPSGL